MSFGDLCNASRAIEAGARETKAGSGFLPLVAQILLCSSAPLIAFLASSATLGQAATPDSGLASQLHCRTYYCLLTEYRNPFHSTPGQAYGTFSSAKVFLDLICHLAIHCSSSMRSTAITKAIFCRGLCKHRMQASSTSPPPCREDWSDCSPGPGPVQG